MGSLPPKGLGTAPAAANDARHVSSQQDLLQVTKNLLDVTWDELAERAGIMPRAMKNYRLPDTSSNHRGMPVLARRAVERLLDGHLRKAAREAA